MENWEEYIKSSIYQAKKAVSEFNNILDNERIANFIIHIHIAFNRAFIAYCIKNEKKYIKSKDKVKEFSQLLNAFKSWGILTKKDFEALEKLNKIRNDIHHNIPINDDVSINNFNHFIFQWLIVQIYESLLMQVDSNAKIKLYITGDISSNTNVNVEGNWYLKHLSEFISKQDQNYLDDIKISQMIKYKDWIAFSKLSDYPYTPTDAIEKIKKEIHKFNMADFTNIRKVFSIFTNSFRDPHKFEEYRVNLKYAYVDRRLNKWVNDKFVILLINICKKQENYKDFFKKQFAKKEHLNLEKYLKDIEKLIK